jgi:DNA-binding MarR family transcriptional regulator
MENGHEGQTTLEQMLRLHGQFRRCLELIGVTPLQAGVLLHLHRHRETNMTKTAAAFCIRPPTLTEVIDDLVRKRWITRRRSTPDTRVVQLRLSLRGGEPLSSKSNMAWEKGEDADRTGLKPMKVEPFAVANTNQTKSEADLQGITSGVSASR